MEIRQLVAETFVILKINKFICHINNTLSIFVLRRV